MNGNGARFPIGVFYRKKSIFLLLFLLCESDQFNCEISFIFLIIKMKQKYSSNRTRMSDTLTITYEFRHNHKWEYFFFFTNSATIQIE